MTTVVGSKAQVQEMIAVLRKARCGSHDLDMKIWLWLRPIGDERGLRYTRELTHAAKLVPVGRFTSWGVATHPPAELFNPAGAQAYVTSLLAPEGSPERCYAHSDAPTPELALCIAALKYVEMLL